MTAFRSAARCLAACSVLWLAGCGSTEDPVPVAPQATTAPIAAPAPLPVPPSAGRALALTFTVDSSRSVGTIDTTLDPAGVTLGPRRGTCRTPLTGRIKAVLHSRPDGSRQLELTEVSLATTQASHLHYEWSVLLGDISCTIPGGRLTIDGHRLAGPAPLDARHRFRTPGNRFSVKCPSHIKGSGLVLAKAVGERKENLDIPVTGEVLVEGSCTHEDGRLVLRIPGAVLRDDFDLGKATLDLVFTGDITASCRLP